MRYLAFPFKDRGKRADEYLQILKKIWTDDIVEYRGQFYDIPASKIGPKPIQKPHIPIYLGGYSQNTTTDGDMINSIKMLHLVPRVIMGVLPYLILFLNIK